MEEIILGIGARPIKIELTDEEYNKCAEFGLKMFQREFHLNIASSRNVSPEKLRDDHINGKMFEVGVKKFLEDRFNIKCSEVDYHVRNKLEAVSIAYDPDLVIKSDGYKIHIKSSRNKSNPSYVFMKNDSAYGAPNEYDWVVGGVLCDWGSELSCVKIYSVYPLQKAKSLKLFKDLDNQDQRKQALNAFDFWWLWCP